MARQRFSGDVLRERREAAHLQREALALRVGRSAQTIALYELGAVSPPVEILSRLADALECVPGDFFAEVERVAG